jgi:F0F1-type ATP synthase membrane subunit c/vacuolar-type H+-ATPase subunit K
VSATRGIPSDDDDPGWPSLAAYAKAIPRMVLPRMQTKSGGLVALRLLVLQFATMLVVFFVILARLDARSGSLKDPPFSGVVAATIVVVAGLVCAGVARCFGRRSLPCGSDASLAATYRTRFFLFIAFAEAPALLGFVLYFVAGSLWSCALGFLIAMSGLAYAAPTRRRLAQDQARLGRDGCDRSLIRALT